MRRIEDDIGSTEYVIMLYDIKAAFSLLFLSAPSPFFNYFPLVCCAYLRGERLVWIFPLKSPYTGGKRWTCLYENGGEQVYLPVRLMSELRNGVAGAPERGLNHNGQA